MRIADSACLALVQPLPAEFATEPAFDFLLLTFQRVKDPFVFRAIGTLEVQFHARLGLRENQVVRAAGYARGAAQPVVVGRADILEPRHAAGTKFLQGCCPERMPQPLASLAGALDGLLLGILGRHADHEVRRLRCRDDLLEVDEELFSEAVRHDPEALRPHPVPEQPEHGRGDLLAEVRRDQHKPLLVPLVQHQIVQVLDIKEVAQVRRRVRAREPAVEIGLIDLDDFRFLQAGAVRDVFERLPHDILA